MNTLEQLKKFTTVVVDTGDFYAMQDYLPMDATTNPSLILKTVQKDEYRSFFEKVVFQFKKMSLSDIVDQLLVEFGKKILEIVPGRVSTEVDARLSFDTLATIQRAYSIIRRYEDAGISRQRVLIKIASTWEGICAAEILEKDGIHCNMTLLFSLVQAVAAAEVNAKLISPFVGRIYDWFKREAGHAWNEENNQGDRDPGVKFVRRVFEYFKYFGYKTEIMGASFRNIDQILSLAGCDFLTISPSLLKTLQTSTKNVEKCLDVSKIDSTQLKKMDINQNTFRWYLNEDPMATEKLSEGIRLFASDIKILEDIIQAL